MAARKPISLLKGKHNKAQTWPDEPTRLQQDLIDNFLLWSVKQNSSDVTFQTDRPIYHEIDGVLYAATFRALDAADMAAVLHKIYGPEAQAKLAAGKDLDISYEVRPDRTS